MLRRTSMTCLSQSSALQRPDFRGIRADYSRPVRSWMRRRSPGGARVSSVRGRPAKTSFEKTSSSSPSRSPRARFSRQAAFLEGEQPQWTESGLPPQLPRSRFPWSMTPKAMTPITRAKAEMVTRRVASTRVGVAAPSPVSSKNGIAEAKLTTNSGRTGDGRQYSCHRAGALGGRPASHWARTPRNYYVGVTRPSLGCIRSGGPSNRYGEVIVDSRSLAPGLVLGAPSTQKNVDTEGEAPGGNSQSV